MKFSLFVVWSVIRNPKSLLQLVWFNITYNSLFEEEEKITFTQKPCRFQSELKLPNVNKTTIASTDSWLNSTESTAKNDEPFDFSEHGILNEDTRKQSSQIHAEQGRAFELIKMISFILCCKVCAEADAQDSRQPTQVNSLVPSSAYSPLAVKKIKHFLLIVSFFKQLYKTGRQLQYHWSVFSQKKCLSVMWQCSCTKVSQHLQVSQCAASGI